EEQLRRDPPHILDLVFNREWSVRERLAPCWEEASHFLVEAFYLDQLRVGTAGQRWYELLLARLRSLDGFRSVWQETTETGRRELLQRHAMNDAGQLRLRVKLDDERVLPFR